MEDNDRIQNYLARNYLARNYLSRNCLARNCLARNRPGTGGMARRVYPASGPS